MIGWSREHPWDSETAELRERLRCPRYPSSRKLCGSLFRNAGQGIPSRSVRRGRIPSPGAGACRPSGEYGLPADEAEPEEAPQHVHACAGVTPACSAIFAPVPPPGRRPAAAQRTASSKRWSAFSTRSATAPGAVAHLLAPDRRRMRPPPGRTPYCPSPFAPAPRPGNDHPVVMALRHRSSPLTARLKGAPLPVRTTTCGATLSRRATYRTPHFGVQWAEETTGPVRCPGTPDPSFRRAASAGSRALDLSAVPCGWPHQGGWFRRSGSRCAPPPSPAPHIRGHGPCAWGREPDPRVSKMSPRAGPRAGASA